MTASLDAFLGLVYPSMLNCLYLDSLMTVKQRKVLMVILTCLRTNV